VTLELRVRICLEARKFALLRPAAPAYVGRGWSTHPCADPFSLGDQVRDNGVANGSTSADAPARQELTYLAPEADQVSFASRGFEVRVPWLHLNNPQVSNRPPLRAHRESPWSPLRCWGVASGWVDGSRDADVGCFDGALVRWDEGDAELCGVVVGGRVPQGSVGDELWRHRPVIGVEPGPPRHCWADSEVPAGVEGEGGRDDAVTAGLTRWCRVKTVAVASRCIASVSMASFARW
jgi:hypothetical protein